MNNSHLCIELLYITVYMLYITVYMLYVAISDDIAIVIVKATPHVYTENKDEEGVSRDPYNTRQSQVLYDCRDTHPSAILFVWLRDFFVILANSDDQDINKCLNNLFLVIE